MMREIEMDITENKKDNNNKQWRQTKIVLKPHNNKIIKKIE